MIILYENPWFSVVQEGEYHFVRELNAHNGAAVLIVADDDFIMVEVERPGLGRTLLEVPRGYGNEGESSAECALREGFEETGFKLGAPVLLGSLNPNSAILLSQVDLFVARALDRGPMGSKDNEAARVQRVPINEVPLLISEGKITDGFTLACLAYYWAKLQHAGSVGV